MGNTNGMCQMSNYSKRNVRVFLTEKAEEMDAFIRSEGGAATSAEAFSASSDKRFMFREDAKCVRVLASQTQEVPWEADHFLSILVEDGDDENVCSKQIMLNMALSAPVTVLLYDV